MNEEIIAEIRKVKLKKLQEQFYESDLNDCFLDFAEFAFMMNKEHTLISDIQNEYDLIKGYM